MVSIFVSQKYLLDKLQMYVFVVVVFGQFFYEVALTVSFVGVGVFVIVAVFIMACQDASSSSEHTSFCCFIMKLSLFICSYKSTTY